MYKEFLDRHLVDLTVFLGVYACIVNFAIQLARI